MDESLLEPCEMKVSRMVLRGGKESNFFLLSDEPLDDGYPYMHLLFDSLIMYQCRVIGQ